MLEGTYIYTLARKIKHKKKYTDTFVSSYSSELRRDSHVISRKEEKITFQICLSIFNPKDVVLNEPLLYFTKIWLPFKALIKSKHIIWQTDAADPQDSGDHLRYDCDFKKLSAKNMSPLNWILWKRNEDNTQTRCRRCWFLRGASPTEDPHVRTGFTSRTSYFWLSPPPKVRGCPAQI